MNPDQWLIIAMCALFGGVVVVVIINMVMPDED